MIFGRHIGLEQVCVRLRARDALFRAPQAAGTGGCSNECIVFVVNFSQALPATPGVQEMKRLHPSGSKTLIHVS